MLLRRTRLENNRRCLIGSRTSSTRRCDPLRVRAVHICAHRSPALPRHTQAQVRPRSSRLHDQRLESDQTGLLRQTRSGCACISFNQSINQAKYLEWPKQKVHFKDHYESKEQSGSIVAAAKKF